MKYLWKYMSLDKFTYLLDKEALYLPSVKQLKNTFDPNEAKILNCMINTFNKNFEKYDIMLKNSKQNTLVKAIQDFSKQSKLWYENLINNETLNHTFVYSMSEDKIENYSLWKIYPTDISGTIQTNQGIALKINKNFFNKYFCNNEIIIKNYNLLNELGMESYRLDNIKYLPYKEIEDIIKNGYDYRIRNNTKDLYWKAFFTKTNYYSFAQEKRYIVQISRYSDFMQDEISNIWIMLDLKKLFENGNCKIIISPFASVSLMDYVKYLLKEKGINDVDNIVLKSEIEIPIK